MRDVLTMNVTIFRKKYFTRKNSCYFLLSSVMSRMITMFFQFTSANIIKKLLNCLISYQVEPPLLLEGTLHENWSGVYVIKLTLMQRKVKVWVNRKIPFSAFDLNSTKQWFSQMLAMIFFYTLRTVNYAICTTSNLMQGPLKWYKGFRKNIYNHIVDKFHKNLTS